LRRYNPTTGSDLGVFTGDPSLVGPNFFHFGVPEPSSALLVLGAFALCAIRRPLCRETR